MSDFLPGHRCPGATILCPGAHNTSFTLWVVTLLVRLEFEIKLEPLLLTCPSCCCYSYRTTAPTASLTLLNEISRYDVIPRTIAACRTFIRKVPAVQILLISSIKSYHVSPPPFSHLQYLPWPSYVTHAKHFIWIKTKCFGTLFTSYKVNHLLWTDSPSLTILNYIA